MKPRLIYCITFILILISATHCFSNVYIIIYATLNGKTGHAGIAIDNYDIIGNDYGYDSIANGTITYFDLWPTKDNFGLFSFSKNHEGVYYQLPNAIWSSPLTITTLYDKGIPHRERYPADAILMWPSTAKDDLLLRYHLEQVVAQHKTFNPRFYNCSDFVNDALKVITGKTFKIKEFIPLSFTATPNKLCRVLLNQKEVTVLKFPAEKINGSFFKERVLKRKKKTHNPSQQTIATI